ncbi:hypothetical protein D9619_002455 [Psilocybe cf. subviscida]|uniref:Uncharacterized protein n=1 Tax=Psilocybe cf. subviscida TaxID=2480587 RepID=A0A8H5AXL5_9AGAR|nr:hypothetical protein D9619_002455 [Psilocybe cf. subviscida]
MAASLPSPMATPSRSVSRTIKWTTPQPLVSSDEDSDFDSDSLPNYSVTLNKRTEHVPNHLFGRATPPADTSVQLEFNTECDVDVTLSAGNIDVLLKSPDKASTMHLSRRQSDGTWNVQMRKAVAAAAAIQEDSKPSIRRSLFSAPAITSREWSLSSFVLFLRDHLGTLILLGIVVSLLPGNFTQDGE